MNVKLLNKVLYLGGIYRAKTYNFLNHNLLRLVQKLLFNLAVPSSRPPSEIGSGFPLSAPPPPC